MSDRLRNEIGLRINKLLLNIPKDKDVLINDYEIAEDIIDLLLRFKNTTGTAIITDRAKIEFNKKLLRL